MIERYNSKSKIDSVRLKNVLKLNLTFEPTVGTLNSVSPMSSSDFLLDFGVDISTFFVKLLYKDQLRPDTFHGKCKQILCKLFYINIQIHYS